MAYEVFRIENLVTENNGIKALSDFHLSVNKGDVKGIYISQGSVKQSLIETLTGNMPILKGDFYIEDEPVSLNSLMKHIYVIESKSKLINSLSIANNIFIIRDGISEQLLDDQILDQQVYSLLRSLDINVNLSKSIQSLNVFEKVIIEIVKAIGLGRKVIVFKDLSSFLADDDLRKLNQIIRRLSEDQYSFLYIDSFLEVLEKMTDTVVWLKDGRNKWEFKDDYSELKKKEALEINESIDNHHETNPVMTLEGLGLSVKAYKGEIINILDPHGHAIDTIMNAIGGGKTESIEISIGGRPLNVKDSDGAVKEGIGFISDNPTETMLIPHLNALDNLCYIVERKIPWFWMFKRYRLSILNHYEEKFERLNHEVYIDQLSIYDRQRLVYYKWHAYKPKVIFIYRPFTSIDQELRQLTYDLMKELSDSGITIILLSNNISEMRIAGRRYSVKSKK